MQQNDPNEFDLNTCFKQQPNSIELDEHDDYGSNFNMYEDSLKDQDRTKPFVNAINRNQHLFKDKIVLDINCGLGLLSIMAVKAGAKHVYAIEPSSVIAYTKLIVSKNGCQDKITLLNQKLQDQALPVQNVDIILCQWMGYFMFFEDQIDTVIFARDKYLSKDGLIFPDRGVLYLAALEDEQYREKKLNFWDKVYGVRMSHMKDWVVSEPLTENVKQNQLVSEPCAVYELDLYKVRTEELDFSNSFKLKLNRNDYIHGMLGWFEVYFTACHLPIRLSTAPFYKTTYWKQTIFYFKDTLIGFKDQVVTGNYNT